MPPPKKECKMQRRFCWCAFTQRRGCHSHALGSHIKKFWTATPAPLLTAWTRTPQHRNGRRFSAGITHALASSKPLNCAFLTERRTWKKALESAPAQLLDAMKSNLTGICPRGLLMRVEKPILATILGCLNRNQTLWGRIPPPLTCVKMEAFNVYKQTNK